MQTQLLVLIAARASALYFAWVLGVRLLSRRALTSADVIDLPVLLLTLISLDELLAGTLPLAKGGVLILSVAAWHLAHGWVAAAPLSRRLAAQRIASREEPGSPAEALEGQGAPAETRRGAPVAAWPGPERLGEASFAPEALDRAGPD